ncbi:MAG: LamG-like jellyroll fold domain-containing protein [Bacteroidota bacterium]
MRKTTLHLCLLLLWAGLSLPAFAQQALFVSGSYSLNSSDAAAKSRLQSMGYTVTVKSARDAASSHANGKDLILISSTVNSGDVNTKFRSTSVPVIVWEPWLYDYMKMTWNSSGSYGRDNAREIKVLDASHPMAAGLTGRFHVLSHNKPISWGKPAHAAKKIASLPWNHDKVTIFAYEAGDQMCGMSAPGRRVGLYLNDHSLAHTNNDGKSLFDAAVRWAAGTNAGGGGGNTACSANGKIKYEAYHNIGGHRISDLTNAAIFPNSPSDTRTLTLFEAPSNIRDNYGVRISGYICPPQSGDYVFYVAGDDNSQLWLSTDHTPGNKRKIAYHDGWTGSRQWNKFTSQCSQRIHLQAGQTYYIEALMKEGGGGDNLAVGWKLPNGQFDRPISGQYLADQLSSTPPTAATGILYEKYDNVSGTSISSLKSNSNFPGSPASTTVLNKFEAPTNVDDHYGVRMSGFVKAPSTGTYFFYIAGDDNVELSLSTDEDPANKRRIAYHNGWTSSRQWDRYSSQKSSGIQLVAGQRYYIEALMNEGGGGDNLAVGWKLPNGHKDRPISGQYLCPPSAPTAPVANTCHITDYSGSNRSFILFGLGSYTFDSNGGTLTEFTDGTATITGTVKQVNDANKKWQVNFKLKNKRTWAQWSGMGRKAKNGGNGDKTSWDYYELDGSSSFTGLGTFAGKSLSFTNRPSNLEFGFQIGNGANDKTTEFGISGWFSYSGDYSGNGDINAGLNCGNTPPPPGSGNRVDCNLVAFYSFEEGQGNTVHDRSGVGVPIDLHIDNTNRVTWLNGGGLRINSGTKIASNGPAAKFNAFAMSSQEVTLEVWVKPENITQAGPARLITVSKNTGERNVTLGQEGSRYVGRIRTTDPSIDNNGMPEVRTGSNQAVTNALQHIVYTRKANGEVKIYVNGTAVKTANQAGKLWNWNTAYKLALGNEFTHDRPWKGIYYMVAMYDRALDNGEVSQNYQAGALAPLGGTACTTPATPTVVEECDIDDYNGNRWFWTQSIGEYTWSGTPGKFIRYSDGTASFSGKVVKTNDPNKKFQFEVFLKNKQDWNTWSGMGGGYKGPASIVQNNFTDWNYYELDGRKSIFIGEGSFAGDTFYVATRSDKFGFQEGIGANDKDGDNGFSYWFDLIGKNGVIHSDFNADIECNPQAGIVKVCTVFDYDDSPNTRSFIFSAGIGRYTFGPNGGTYTEFDDGTAAVTGLLTNINDQSKQWEVTLKLKNKRNWAQWSALGRSFLNNGGNTGDETMWDYYEIDETMSRAIGRGFYVGKTLEIYHKPVDFNYGVQVGRGANDKDGSFGIGGWFFFRGDFSGNGDINSDLECVSDVVKVCQVFNYDDSRSARSFIFSAGLGRYTFDSNGGTYTEFSDGTATVTGVLENINDATKKWDITLTIVNKRNWTEWSALGRSFLNNGGGTGDNLTWDYYEVDPSRSFATGLGFYGGKTIYLTHKPVDFNYGVQVGLGANDKDGDFGIGGWFFFNGDYTGNGDINSDLICTPTVPQGGRVDCGLVAYYDFNEGSGNKVYDRSGVSNALDLNITDLSKVSWVNGGLKINSGTRIESSGPAAKFNAFAVSSGELTIEAWVKPENNHQSGPARIVTISKDAGNRNVTFGQGGNRYVGRLRTNNSNNDNNGMPDLNASTNSVTAQTLKHVVMTRDKDGLVKIYVDGVEKGSFTRTGEFWNWDASYRLAIGNEFNSWRPWKGTYFMMALYNKALTEAEVNQNFQEGSEGANSGAVCAPVPPATPVEECEILDYNNHRWVWTANEGTFTWDGTPGKLIRYDDGTAKFEGSIKGTSNANKKFDIVVWLKNKQDWATWSANGRGFKGGAKPQNHPTWDYYELDGERSLFIGKGSFANDTFFLVNRAPQYGYQIGVGANDKDHDFGFSGWFDLVSNNRRIKADFNTDLRCLPAPCANAFYGKAGTGTTIAGHLDGTEAKGEGAPDQQGVQIHENSDVYQIELSRVVPQGETYVLYVRKKPGVTGTPVIDLDESTNGTDFHRHPNSANFAVYSSDWIGIVVEASRDVKKLRLSKGTKSTDDYQFDAVEFCQPSSLLGSIGDFVFLDDNEDGIQDQGEEGIENIEVELLDCDGNVLAKDTTDAMGRYLFTDLPTGDYVVKVLVPADLKLTGQDRGNNDELDSDADLDGKTSCFTLDPGEEDLSRDFGLFPACRADAGTLTVKSDPIYLLNGTAKIGMIPNGDAVIPNGYATLYLLADSASETILQTNGTFPNFFVTEVGSYLVTTLVYSNVANSPDFFDVNSIVLGTSTLRGVMDDIQNAGICAVMDNVGGRTTVEPFDPPVYGLEDCELTGYNGGTIITMTLGGTTRYYVWDQFGATKRTFTDGSALIKGVIVDNSNANNKWLVNIKLNNEQDWTEWSGNGGTYASGAGQIAIDEHPNWTYYEVDEANSFFLGKGSNDGDTLTVSLRSSMVGFQQGFGANDKNADNGLYGGINLGGAQTGGADLNARINCEPVCEVRILRECLVYDWDTTDRGVVIPALRNLPSGGLFNFGTTPGRFVEYADGTARLTGIIYSKRDRGYAWRVDVNFYNKVDWDTWSSLGRTYNAQYESSLPAGVSVPKETWDYYLVDDDNSFLIGLGQFAGDTITVEHKPRNLYKGVQVGLGANDKRIDQEGLASWFIQGGDYPFQGSGDFNVRFECIDPQAPPAKECVLRPFDTDPTATRNWDVIMSGAPGQPGGKYFFDEDGGLIERFPNGTARITGTIVHSNSQFPNAKWNVEVWLKNLRDWDAWSGLGRTYLSEDPISALNHIYWGYYEVDDTRSAFRGVPGSDFDGEVIYIENKPRNLEKGFQIGPGANGKNGNEGLAGWFFYTGDYSGNGDFNNTIECIEEDDIGPILHAPVAKVCDLNPYDGGSSAYTVTMPTIPAADGGTDYVFVPGGDEFITFTDGSAHIFGTLVSKSNPNYGWIIDLMLKNRQTWAEWEANGRTYQGPANDLNHFNWAYYELDEMHSRLIGIGLNDCKALNLSQAPRTFTSGFQIGDGANDINSNFGLFGWFNYSGFYHGTAEMNATIEGCEVNCPEPVRVAAKVLLQGPYDATSGEMTTDLVAGNALPIGQPYSNAPFYYGGYELADSLPATLVDWVLVQLRDANDPTQIVQTRAALLDKDGTLKDAHGNKFVEFKDVDESKDYFIAVLHRNHAGFMSKLPVPSGQGRFFYDFTGGLSQLYKNTNLLGEPAVELSNGVTLMTMGDVTKDGVVNSTDRAEVVAKQLTTGYVDEDVDLNGMVDSGDQTKVESNYQKASHIPNQPLQ